MSDENLLQCYNRGCGQTYNPTNNNADSCRHHPGQPVFHDAYKGWSCCNKKCRDFTEFLNIKGCTLSQHSNIKPPEPEKPVEKEIPDTEVIEVKPIIPSVLQRPPFDTPMVTMVPEIAPSLKQTLNSDSMRMQNEKTKISGEIEIGTICKNGACNQQYEGPETNKTVCQHHPGVPVFHEGLKFWSCCLKKTTDFNTFLSQTGCATGTHLWVKDKGENTVNCRWDHHQTPPHVIVSIYAKQYCPNKSVIKLNPIRLYASLVFPKENNAVFKLDIELRGIVDVQASQVSMFATKVEIKLKKAEPGTWLKLEVPRVSSDGDRRSEVAESVEDIIPHVEEVDLSDL